MRRSIRPLRIALVVAVIAVSATAFVALGADAATNPVPRAAAVVRLWRSNITRGASVDPRRRFANPPKATLLARLQRAARPYNFQVVEVEILHPRQQAPLVVVRAADERALAKATPAILQAIDPKTRTNDDRTGWAYEGFLFEAVNQKDIPFLATFNWWRGPHAGGGQWAADPSLYPFDHG